MKRNKIFPVFKRQQLIAIILILIGLNSLSAQQLLTTAITENHEPDLRLSQFDFSDKPDRLFNQFTENRMTAQPSTGDNKTRKTYWRPEGKVGFGTFYKSGFFRGDISELLSDYQAYKPLYVDLRLENFYIDMGWSFVGTMGEISQITMAGKIYPGKFYGKFDEFYLSGGYALYHGRRISFVPTIGLSRLKYKVYPLETKMFVNATTICYEVEESTSVIFGWGPGAFFDFRLLSFGDWDEMDISIRTRYNAYFVTYEKIYGFKGMMHELSIGIIFSIGFDVY